MEERVRKKLDREFRNTLLGRLDEDDFGLISPHLVPVNLPLRLPLARANVAVEQVYFLETGIASVVTSSPSENPIEIGVIGREGVVNVSALLDSDQSPNDCHVQAPGHGHMVAVPIIRDLMLRSAGLRVSLLNSVHVFMCQTASTVLASGRGTVERRLARWLLMAHDRLEGDTIVLTHDFLGLMLGTRRAGVTVALQALDRRGVVERRRGRITIVDRQALLDLAGDYYGTAEAEHARLFGDPKVHARAG
jgi:CRP-like cAMP-binding protein